MKENKHNVPESSGYFFFHKSTQRIVARMPSIFQERGVYQGLCLEWILQNHAHENRENRKSSSVTKHVLLADEFIPYRLSRASVL